MYYVFYCRDHYQQLTLDSCLNDLKQTPLNRSQQLPAPSKQLIDRMKQNLPQENDWTTDNVD